MSTTSHSLSIAKASLLASCLRSDAPKLSRDGLAEFHALLEKALSQCSPTNIQKTKQWLLHNIFSSPTRTTAFVKYLSSLCKHIEALPSDSIQATPCRKRLHVLYVINDIFHHTKHHDGSDQCKPHIRNHIPPILPELFANAAADKKRRTTKRLLDLIQIWSDEEYCDQKTLTTIREAVSSGAKPEHKDESIKDTKPSSKELPWIMPATHGDPDAPFFDLPAATLMPHIIPNSSRPLRPDQIHALPMNAGPADESLVNALKDFLKEVKAIDDPYATLEDEGIVPDIDEMGQMSYKNEAGDLVGDTYYGWSKTFCEKMKNRGKNSSEGRGRLRSRSSSRESRSLSRSSRKRRRYSSSRSHSRSRSRFDNRVRQRFGSGDRMASPPRLSAARSSSPVLQPLRDQPRQPPVYPQSHAPPPPPPPPLHQLPHQPYQQMPMPPFQPPPLGTNGSPVPPPRPPNWQGPWPPPPPPPPSMHGSPPGPFPGIPFPPPPPSHGPNNHGFGRR